jgi:hypothetical protein
MGETVVLGGLVDVVLAIGPKVRRFRSGRGRCIFKAIKFRQHDFLRRGIGSHVARFYGMLIFRVMKEILRKAKFISYDSLSYFATRCP